MKRYEYSSPGKGPGHMSLEPGGRWLYVVEVIDWLREVEALLDQHRLGDASAQVDDLLAELESEP